MMCADDMPTGPEVDELERLVELAPAAEAGGTEGAEDGAGAGGGIELPLTREAGVDVEPAGRRGDHRKPLGVLVEGDGGRVGPAEADRADRAPVVSGGDDRVDHRPAGWIRHLADDRVAVVVSREWTLRRGIEELFRAYMDGGLTSGDWEGDRYVRLRRIRTQLDAGILDSDLRYVDRSLEAVGSAHGR